jgi:hypothetical protein
MKNSWIALVLVSVTVFGGLASRSANAAMMGLTQFSLMGGMNDTLNTGGGVGWLGGVGISTGLGSAVGVEVDGLYLSRNYTGGNINFIQVPAIIRFGMLPMFSIGGGGFFDFPVTSGASTNAGILGSLKFQPIMAPVFIEARYLYGLKDTNSSEFQILGGLSF